MQTFKTFVKKIETDAENAKKAAVFLLRLPLTVSIFYIFS